MEEKTKRDYCVNCKNKPCSNNGCPLNNDIPAFIHENDYKKAFEILCNTTVLPAICGRICPHEKQCEGSCIRKIKGKSVEIGEIESIIGEVSIKEGYKISTCIDSKLKDKKVAIVGGGPAGLTAAAFLARKGVSVTIYEKHNRLGGILEHGIPQFRLEKDILLGTIEKILEIGNIEVKYNIELEKNIIIEQLEKDYDAVFLAFGANIPCKMNIEGENLDGVYGANDVLEYDRKLELKDKNIAVIGGGNVAIDMARTAIRKDAKNVTIIYRRSEEQMPAEKDEIEKAKTEGIKFLFKTNVVKILPKAGKDIVGNLECIKTDLVKKTNEDRLVPVNIEGSNYNIDTDIVFMAVGSCTDSEIVENLGLELNKYKNIEVDKEYKTSKDKIFAGGDLVGEKSTVAWAARSGREAAYSIIKYLREKNA